MLQNRNLAFICDAPTEALGNCFPYAIMQQLHRPEIQSTLSEELKLLSQNYHYLRKAIVKFVKDISPDSEYFALIDQARANYTELVMDKTNNLPKWDTRLTNLSKDGIWFDDQFLKFTALFLKMDIICYTSTGNIRYCGAATELTYDRPSDASCDCVTRPLHIANIRNVHFQSILPLQITFGTNTAENKKSTVSKELYSNKKSDPFKRSQYKYNQCA